MDLKSKAAGLKEESRTSVQKSYFDVMGLCCSSEIPLVRKILTSLEGVQEVRVIVPSKTVIVLHDSLLVSAFDIAKALNQARLEANVRVKGQSNNHPMKWPSLYVIPSGLLLGLSFLKYVYSPVVWLAMAAVVAGVWPIFMRGLAAMRNVTMDVSILVIIAVLQKFLIFHQLGVAREHSWPKLS